MAYVGTHRALRPLPVRHPAITSAASAAVLGIGFAAFGIAAMGSSSDSSPPRLTIPGDQVVADGQPSPVATTGAGGETLPGGSPLIAPASQESTGTTRSPGTSTTTRTRRPTGTTSAGTGTNVTSTKTSSTTRSTRTTTRAQATSTKPSVGTTTTTSNAPTTISVSPTTTTDSGEAGAGGGN